MYMPPTDTTPYEPAREGGGNAVYLDRDGAVRDLPSFIAPPSDWRPLFVRSDKARALAERAADSDAAGRWTARRGVNGWYVEDGTGRVICEAPDGGVAAYIAAMDPANFT